MHLGAVQRLTSASPRTTVPAVLDMNTCHARGKQGLNALIRDGLVRTLLRSEDLILRVYVMKPIVIRKLGDGTSG